MQSRRDEGDKYQHADDGHDDAARRARRFPIQAHRSPHTSILLSYFPLRISTVSSSALAMRRRRKSSNILSPCRETDDDERANDRDRGADEVGHGRTLALDDPEPRERRSDVDPAIRRVCAPGKWSIDPRKDDRETNQACDAEQRHRRRRPTPQPRPEGEATG